MLVVGARPQIHRVGKKPAPRARLHALRTAGCAEPGTMLRLPRAAHYSICESLCARDTANLIETASQWSRKDDPRHAAMRACLVDRVARAREVTENARVVQFRAPGSSLASMLKFLDAVVEDAYADIMIYLFAAGRHPGLMRGESLLMTLRINLLQPSGIIEARYGQSLMLQNSCYKYQQHPSLEE